MYAGQRSVQPRRVGAASHGHIRLAATFAAHLLGHKVHQLTSFHFADQIFGHASSQLHFLTVHSGQHDGGRFQLVFELVHGVAQRGGISTVQLGRQHFQACDVNSLVYQLIALAGGQLALECSDFFFQRFDLVLHLADTLQHLVRRRAQSACHLVYRIFQALQIRQGISTCNGFYTAYA